MTMSFLLHMHAETDRRCWSAIGMLTLIYSPTLDPIKKEKKIWSSHITYFDSSAMNADE